MSLSDRMARLVTRHLVAETLRPYVGPVAVDVLKAGSTVRFAEDDSPAGGNICEDRPQAVLLFVIDQYKKTDVVVIEWVDTQRVFHPPV